MPLTRLPTDVCQESARRSPGAKPRPLIVACVPTGPCEGSIVNDAPAVRTSAFGTGCGLYGSAYAELPPE